MIRLFAWFRYNSDMKIQSERVVHTTKEAGWLLDKGHGDREHRERVTFQEPFEGTPEVRVPLAHLDIVSSRRGRNGEYTALNTRIGVDAFNIDSSGFDLVFQTWEDTQIAGLGVIWLAYGK